MSKTKVIDGIRYHADRPDSCRACYFYKNRKIGCVPDKKNTYYFVEYSGNKLSQIKLY